MKTEQITSNRGRHHYRLTPTELIELRPLGYTLQVSEIRRMEDTVGTVAPEITCICRGNNLFYHFSYYLDKKGHLHIGCREFNKTMTKKLLRWAGLL